MANLLMGSVPATVSAAVSSIVDHEIGSAGYFDTAIITLTYAVGRIGVINITGAI